MTKAAELAKMGEVLTNSQIGGRRNIIINGAMKVAQRGTVTGMGDSNKYSACDRFQITSTGTNGRLTSSQDSDAPDGFANSLKLACTTAVADADIASGALTRIRQRIEGQDVQQLKKGTSDAEKVTLTYYAKADTAGVYIIEAQDNDNNRIVSVAHSITTSYQKFTHTFPADTTGALNNDNSTSFTISWYLHVGSDFKSGTLGSAFASKSDGNSGVGQTGNVFKTTSSTFFLAGVQLEVGEQATPFEHRSFGEELALCQRYCYVADGNNRSALSGAYFHSSTAVRGAIVNFPVTMRSAPTITASGTASNFNIGRAGSSNTGGDSLPTTTQINKESYEFQITAAASSTTGHGTRILLLSDAKLTIDAEL
tara:strand:- start:1835 stop:2938 length:1104 start_codon:yes stop_codon:yes gene_type:complete